MKLFIILLSIVIVFGNTPAFADQTVDQLMAKRNYLLNNQSGRDEEKGLAQLKADLASCWTAHCISTGRLKIAQKAEEIIQLDGLLLGYLQGQIK